MILGFTTFLTAVAFTTALPSSSLVLRWVVVSLGAAALVWCFRGRVRVTPGHWAGMAFLGWVSLGLLWSISPYTTEGTLFHYLMLAPFFVVAAEAKDLTPAWFGFVAGVTVSALLAVAQFFGYGVFDGGGQAWNAVSGLFANKNALAITALLALIMALYHRWWLYAIPLSFAVVQPMSRSVLLAACVVAAWVVARRLRHGWVYGAAALGAVLCWLAVDSDQAYRLVSLNTRSAILQLELANLRWLGWGPGTFGEVLPMYQDGHNEFLQLVFECGVGAAFFFALLIYALGAKAELERVILIAILVDSVFNFPLHQPTVLLACCLAAGRLCGVRHRASLAQHGRGVAGAGSVPRGRARTAAGHL